MKIGLKAKTYNDVVCINFDETSENADQFMTALFSVISSESEEALDFVVTVSKKKTNITKGENETE